MLEALPYVVVALFGLLFGSFGNVVIWRLPRGESLSVPASHCPVCEKPISWYDNIPLVSWALLRGRCRSCKTPISARYPTVELLSGLLWLAAALRFGFTAQTVACIVFFYVLLLLAFIDADTMRLPNSLVGLLAVVGVVGVVAAQVTGVPVVPLMPLGQGLLATPVMFSLVGAIVSAGFVAIIALAYLKIRGVQGFGMGDIKLLAVIGVFLGPYGLMVLFAGSILGTVFGIFVARRGTEGVRHKFPFGPFLALAAVLVTLFGVPVFAWYAGLLTQ